MDPNTGVRSEDRHHGGAAQMAMTSGLGRNLP